METKFFFRNIYDIAEYTPIALPQISLLIRYGRELLEKNKDLDSQLECKRYVGWSVIIFKIQI